MSRVRVKICGITSLTDLFATVEAGADAVGFVVDVPQSPRNLSMNEAREMIVATPIFVETVVVTVPVDSSHLEEIHRKLNPDIIQVHGPKHSFREIRERLPDVRLIGSFQAESDRVVKIATEAMDYVDAIHLDSYTSGKYGGTGRIHDWRVSKSVRDAVHPKPFILAGGLRPENVREAVCVVKPYAVDVSSGVELRPGTKNRDKISEFIRNAKGVEIGATK